VGKRSAKESGGEKDNAETQRGQSSEEEELRCEETGVCGAAAEGAIEGNEGELGGGSEGAEIGIGPIFCGGAAEASQAAGDAFEAAGLVEAGDAVVLEPTVIGLPGLRLIHDFVGHDRFRGEQAEKAKLGEAAEKEAGVRGEPGKPSRGAGVMDVALIGQGHPDVEIREKK